MILCAPAWLVNHPSPLWGPALPVRAVTKLAAGVAATGAGVAAVGAMAVAAVALVPPVGVGIAAAGKAGYGPLAHHLGPNGIYADSRSREQVLEAMVASNEEIRARFQGRRDAAAVASTVAATRAGQVHGQQVAAASRLVAPASAVRVASPGISAASMPVAPASGTEPPQRCEVRTAGFAVASTAAAAAAARASGDAAVVAAVAAEAVPVVLTAE